MNHWLRQPVVFAFIYPNMLNETNDTNEVRGKDGRWLAPPPGSEKTRITTDNARSMVQKRVENYRRKAIQRIVEEAKSIDPSVSVGADAFGLVAAKQYAALMDSEKPRIADLEKLGQIMSGVTAVTSHREDAPPGTVSAAPAVLLELAAMIERRQADAVDRARAIDVESTDTRNDE